MARWPADDDWSPPFEEDVRPAPPEALRADALSPLQKRVVWGYIRAEEPELAMFLEDPDMRRFVASINATSPGSCSPMIPWRVIEACLSLEECDVLMTAPSPSRPAPVKVAAVAQPAAETRATVESVRAARLQFERELKDRKRA
jgi:hypothetical protein